MDRKFYVSMAPHIHSGDSIEKKMYGVLVALIPAFLVSLYVFGWGALTVTAISVASCVIFEYLIQKYLLKVKSSITDGSAILTGILLAFNLPSNLPCWIIVIGALVAIGVAKMSFGGLGNNPFNPALVGRVFLLISFPVQMTSWPLPGEHSYVDATTGATPLGMLHGHFGQLPDMQAMMMGTTGGSLGEVGAIALILGGLYLLFRRIITWHIPVAILGTVFAFTFIMGQVAPESYNIGQTETTFPIFSAMSYALFHLLAGGLLLGSIFMATDYVTSPMTPRGQLVYGVGIGIITVLIRLFGSYPEGVSFAILIMNSITPLINTYIKPKRFGEVRK
ncbi:MAG: RnfABCDGE type electron transport complex subunit D [Bacteroidales bacterium]|nr:RnfABCDGE type electron transport complex subunit D [Bacteroidales bacterium]